MAKADNVKILVAAEMHLRDCTIRPTATCKECLQSLVRIATAQSEAMEVAEAFRAAVRAATPTPGGGAPKVPAHLAHLPPELHGMGG